MKEKLFFLVHKLLIPLILMSLSRMVFYAVNHEYFQVLTLVQTLMTFWAGIRFDMYMVMLINAVYILYILSPFSNSNFKISTQIFKGIYIVSNSGLLLLNFIDTFYYPYIFKRLNTSFLDYLDTQKNMGSLNAQFIIDYWYGLLFLSIFIYILIKTYPKYKAYHLRLSKRKVTVINRYTVRFTIIFAIISCSISDNYNPINGFIKPSETHSFIKNSHQKALALNTGYNIWIDYLFPEAQIPVYETDKVIQNKVADKDAKNVVLLVLESFAHEASGFLNPNTNKSYMPFLDSLMSKSYVFTHSFSNGRQSMDAIPALWNGLPAMERPFILDCKSKTLVSGLPRTLNNRGYTTLFFHGAQNGSMSFDRYAQQNDVQHYYGVNEYPNPIIDFDGTWGIWDEPFLQFTQQTLDTIHQPFFATVFTLSSHNPCKIPQVYENTFLGGNLPIYKSIEYSDYALSNFFNKAKTKAWFKNTLFVITADHSIHPKHDSYKTPENGFAVPIMFYDPSEPSFIGESKRLAQHLDIYPSVLHLLNLKDSNKRKIGNNLFDPFSNEEVINYYNGIYQIQTADSTYLLSSSPFSSIKEIGHKNDNNFIEDLSIKLGIRLFPLTN